MREIPEEEGTPHIVGVKGRYFVKVMWESKVFSKV